MPRVAIEPNLILIDSRRRQTTIHARMRLAPVLVMLFSAGLHAAPTVKRLLVLNPVNEGAQAELSYIGPSLAEAIRTTLAESYFFIHPPEEAMNETQSGNLIQDEDMHTKSAALQMGEWLRQDLVLNGRYSVANGRLRLNLNLYEIETGRVLVNFKTEAPLSAKMFDAFNKIAADLGVKMSEALPSQQALAASGGFYYDPERGKRTFLLSAGMRAVGFAPETSNLTGSTTVSGAEFAHFNAEFTYQRHQIPELLARRSKLPVFVQFGVNMGYARRTYTRNGSDVPTRLITGEAVPSLGYAFNFGALRLEPFAGFGFGYSNFLFDYSALARKPVDTTIAQSVSEQILEQFYFLSQAGANIKWMLHPRWAVVFIPSATVFHFAGGAQAEVNARLGAGFYF